MKNAKTTPHIPNYTTVLRKIFAELSDLLDQMQTSLSNQSTAFTKQDWKTQEACVNQQNNLTAQLEIKQGEIDKICKQYKLPFSKAGILQLINAQSGGLKPELSKEWQALAIRLQKVRRAIEIQQKIVHHSQKSTQHLLNLMKGQTTQGELYQADGQKVKNESHHISAEA